jgi:uncharacterized protein (DUF4415 family)
MTAKRKPIAKAATNAAPLVDDDGEVRELTAEDFKQFRPIGEFPELVEAIERARGQRGPQRTPTKERVALRLDRNIVDHFRHGGPGWQTRINDALAELVKRTTK